LVIVGAVATDGAAPRGEVGVDVAELVVCAASVWVTYVLTCTSARGRGKVSHHSFNLPHSTSSSSPWHVAGERGGKTTYNHAWHQCMILRHVSQRPAPTYRESSAASGRLPRS
jgi:hypothetical protein